MVDGRHLRVSSMNIQYAILQVQELIYLLMYKINYITHYWLVHYKHNKEFLKKAKFIKGLVLDLGCGTAP